MSYKPEFDLKIRCLKSPFPKGMPKAKKGGNRGMFIEIS